MATVLNETGLPFIDTRHGIPSPTVQKPQGKPVVASEDTLLGEPFPTAQNPVRTKTRRSLIDALTSGGKLEEIVIRDGSVDFIHLVGDGALEAELPYKSSLVDTFKGFASDLMQAKNEFLPSIINEVRESVGTPFNKRLFAFMNAAGLSIAAYFANKPIGTDFMLPSAELTDTVNRGIHSVGLDAASTFSLLMLGAVDLLLLTVAKQKKSEKEEKYMWHINAATAVLSTALIGVIGKTLAEDHLLVQHFLHNILTN